MIFLAKLGSFVFNPLVFLLLMPFLTVYKQTESQLSAAKWGIFSALFIGIAFLFLAFGRWKKMFSDFDLSKRGERQKFYYVLWLLAFSYLLIALFFKGVFFYLSIMAFGISFGIVLLTIINQYVKASIHVAVASAFVVTLHFFHSETPLSRTFWIVPLVAWTRFFLKRHTVYELLTGGVIGTTITLLTFLVGKFLYGSG